MEKIKYFILTVATVILTSCATQKYTAPEGVVRNNSSFRNAEFDTTNNFAKINWNEFYSDPFLIALIDSAINNNLDLKIAESSIRAAQESYKQAQAAFFPSLGVSAGVGVSGRNIGGTLQSVWSYSMLMESTVQTTAVAATWEIDVWGKLASVERSQRAALEQTELYYKAVITELVAAVASAYYQLLVYDEQLRIYETSAQTRKQSLEVVEAMKEAAFTNEVAVNQSAAQYLNVMASIPQTKNSIQNTENLIATLIGIEPQEIKRSTFRESLFVEEIDMLKVGVPAQLLANRPDIMAVEQGLIRAHEYWNYTRAAMYPSFVISGNAGFNTTQFNNWFSYPESFIGNLIGGVTQPIFAQRKLKTQKNIAEEQKLQAIYSYKNSILLAQKEVANALAFYQFSKESIVYQEQLVEHLNSAVSGSSELFKNGFVSYLDLLYAEDNALSSSIGLLQTQFQNARAKIELYRALGGGWNKN